MNKILKTIYSEYVAVDITPGEVRVLSVRRNRVEKWRSAPLREGLIKDGVILEPQDLSLVLEDLFTSLALPRKRVICTITGLPFSYRTILMPDTGTGITLEAIERAARKEMSITEPDMYIFWKPLERHVDRKETACFVVAVPRVAIRPLTETLSKTHIDLYDLDIKPLALARLASAQNALMISLEKTYVDIVAVAGGSVKTLYSFPLPNVAADRNMIVNEVVNGLDRTIKSHDHDYPENPMPADTPMMVSGELSAGSEIIASLVETSGHPVVPFASPVELSEGFSPSLYAANLGLILKKSPLNTKIARARAEQYKDIDINLLTGLIKSGFRINPAQAAAALSAILVLSLIYYAWDLRHDAVLKAKNLENQNTSASVQLLVLEKTEKDNEAAQKAGAERVKNLQAQIDSLTGVQKYISNAGIDGYTDLTTVIEVLPDGAVYDSISVDKKGIAVSGQAQDPRDVLAMADELEANNIVAQARIASISHTDTEIGFNLVIQKK